MLSLVFFCVVFGIIGFSLIKIWSAQPIENEWHTEEEDNEYFK
jgi:hypothetical protein